MEDALEWARGPAFYGAFAFMVLGLVRHAVLTLLDVRRSMRRAGDKSLPYKKIFVATVKWLLPLGKVRNRLVFSLTSIAFHVAVLIVPVFLAGHIALWSRGIGISWPAIPAGLADVLTIVAVLTAVALVLQRAFARATQSLSRFQDYAIPLIVALPFASGYLLMHPWANPFAYHATLFVHVMSANLVFVLIPITKLSHMALLPSVQLVSEVAWHFPEDSGSRVGVALGKQEEPI